MTSPPSSNKFQDHLTAPRGDDGHFMRMALRQARLAYGRTSPNPLVGAVLVQQGRVVGVGHHVRAGADHGEVAAFKAATAAGETIAGATLYVNLEPCSFHGRTPPCADACVNAGIRRIVVGTVDPHPQVNGKGLQRLYEAGIEVTLGVEAEDCLNLNAPFFTRVTLGRPHITVKVAMSLDGKIATHRGDSFPMTGEQARASVHRFRDRVDAIMVGRATAELDDPRLTCRLDIEDAGPGGARDPVRVVIDADGRLDGEQQIFRLKRDGMSLAATLVVVADDTDIAGLRHLANPGVDVVRCPRAHDGRLDMAALLSQLGKRELNSVLVEGGGTLIASLAEADLIDVWVAHIAPVLIGGKGAISPFDGTGFGSLAEAPRGQPSIVRRLGQDVEIIAAVRGHVYGFD